MEYQIVSLSMSTSANQYEINRLAKEGWTVHTAEQYFILMERPVNRVATY